MSRCSSATSPSAAGARPERVVLTHRHRDHLGGVAHLRERFPGLPVAKMLWKDTDLPEGITDLRDGDRIEADGATLIAVHTPGHASDHLCYYLPEERALFSGDLILSGSTTVIPEEDGDLGQYLDSLRRVQELGVERIYSAHGPVIDNAAAVIQEYIDHRLLRERQILDALGNGAATIPDIVAIIYAEVPTMLHKMAGQSVHSHLKKLRGEGRVAEDLIPTPHPAGGSQDAERAHLRRRRPRLRALNVQAEYASRPAFGRRLATGPFSASCGVLRNP